MRADLCSETIVTGRKMVHFPSTERKELSIETPISQENVLQEWRINQDMIR